MINEPERDNASRQAMYQQMQRAVPGLDAMYRLVHALIAGHEVKAPNVLIVGAGGGREIEELRGSSAVGRVTAVDPSARNLDAARALAGNAFEVEFIEGTAGDLPTAISFDVVTSLLVMHHLADDGAKLRYLQELRQRLAPGALLIHADMCFDNRGAFNRLIPAFRAYAERFDASADAVRLELGALSSLPVVSAHRMRDLFAEAGFAAPTEVFQTLWYRCWVSAGVQP